MKSLRLLVIFFALMPGQRPVTVEHGSTGLVYRTPNYVAIGADSRASTLGEEEKRTFCKIRLAGSLAFVSVGAISVTDSAFNVPEMATAAQKRGGNLKSTAAIFEREAAPIFAGTLDKLRASRPDYYSTHVAPNMGFMIAFAAFEGEPVIAVRRFGAALVDGKHVVAVTSSNCPSDCSTDEAFLAIGENAVIYRFMKETPNFLALVGYEVAFDFLIRLEAAKNPKLVALPIDILYLDKDGARWIRAKQECK